MAMQIRWYGAKCIAQYGMSRATLDATGRRDCQYLPRIAPADAMVIDCAYVLYCPGGRHGH